MSSLAPDDSSVASAAADTPRTEHKLKPRNPGRVAAFYASAVLAIVAGDVFAVDFLTLVCSWWPWLPSHLWLLIPTSLVLLGAILGGIYWKRHELKGRVFVALFLAFAVLIGVQSLCIGVHEWVEHLTGKVDDATPFQTPAQRIAGTGVAPPATASGAGPSLPVRSQPNAPSSPTIKAVQPATIAQVAPSSSAAGTQPTENAARTLGTALGALFVFGAAWLLAQKWREAVSTYRSLGNYPTTQKAKPLRGLIVLVSPPISVPEIQRDGSAVTKIRITMDVDQLGGGKRQEPAELFPAKDLDAAIRKLESLPDHNWEQLLRSILPVLGTVDHIWLIGSSYKGSTPTVPAAGLKAERDHGSWIYLPLCDWFLKGFLRPETIVHPNFESPDFDGARTDAAVDFENFDALKEHLETCLEQARDFGIKHDEIAIDITGGIKMASVVGATLTLNDETLIQYVPTGGTQTAQIYDLRSDSPIGLE